MHVKSLLLFILFSALLFSISCKKSPSNTGSRIEVEKYDGLLLYRLASASNPRRPMLEQTFSKTIAECYLMGIIKDYPFNFIHEQRRELSLDTFNVVDPLGWKGALDSGSFITVEKDLGLLILESKPIKDGAREVYDSVMFRKEMLPKDGVIDYSNLGQSIWDAIVEAKSIHLNTLRDLQSEGVK